MTHHKTKVWRPKSSLIFSALLASLGLMSFSAPAMAGQAEALAAINRADAKIEMVVRQAGQAGDMGDQSFNMARQRIKDARLALKSSKYDTAEMLANESSLLAALTVEKAVLAALETSHATLLKSTVSPNQ